MYASMLQGTYIYNSQDYLVVNSKTR